MATDKLAGSKQLQRGLGEAIELCFRRTDAWLLPDTLP